MSEVNSCQIHKKKLMSARVSKMKDQKLNDHTQSDIIKVKYKREVAKVSPGVRSFSHWLKWKLKNAYKHSEVKITIKEIKSKKKRMTNAGLLNKKESK